MNFTSKMMTNRHSYKSSMAHSKEKVKERPSSSFNKHIVGLLEEDIRDVFWKGLANPNIKAALHFKYDSGCPVNELMKEVRQQERTSTSKPSKTAASHAHFVESATSPTSDTETQQPKKEKKENQLDHLRGFVKKYLN